MAEEAVNLKITATDVTAAAFNAVKSGLNGISTATNKLADQFNNLGRILTAGAAFQGFKTFINGANDAEGAMNRFEASFKGVSDEATKMQQTLVKDFALTDDGAAKLLTTFNSMFTSMGVSKQGALGLSSSMATLAVDMANFARVPVEQATQDLSMAMAGMTKGLRDYGMMIDDTKIKQEALAQGLGDSKGNLSAVEKAFVMQTLVMREAKDMIGATARAQDSYQVSSQKFKAGLNEAADSIGNFLLPKLNDVFKMFNVLPGAIKVLVVAIPPLVAAIAALGGPVTAVVAAVSALTYVASQLYKKWKDNNEITVEYIANIKDVAKAQELLPKVLAKVEEATTRTENARKTANELNTKAAWDAWDAANREEIQLKGMRNILQGKIKDHENEIAAVEKERNAVLLAEAQKAAAVAKAEEDKKAAREKALKDAEDAAQKEKDRQTQIGEFIKETRIKVIQDQTKQDYAALEAWHQEKLILVQGNLQAMALLEQEYNQQKKVIYDEDIANRAASAAKQVDIEKAKEKMIQDARTNTVRSFAQNMNVIASEFKEAFGIAKAASIAEATMTGYEAALNSFNWGTKIGGPILGGIMAGLSAAATAIQIANIAATPPPFQTAYEQTRTVPGPSNREMLATLHGGETVSRSGGGEVIIRIEGSDDLTTAIAKSLRAYQKETGYQLVPA